jgi:hypothetical protein
VDVVDGMQHVRIPWLLHRIRHAVDRYHVVRQVGLRLDMDTKTYQTGKYLQNLVSFHDVGITTP